MQKKSQEDKRDLRSLKRKQERYNRIISIIIACHHRNKAMLAYLLGNRNFDSTEP